MLTTSRVPSAARLDSELLVRLRDLEQRGGESYAGNGRHGWRNPIRTDTGPILSALVLAHKPRRVLEIGTAYGLSGSYLAAALGPNAMLDTIEFCEEVALDAQAHFDAARLPVRVHCGDALDVIARLDGPYDVVFLDADKRSYLAHLRALSHLLSEGALIIADNVVDRAGEMRDFLGFVTGELEHVLVPTECGLLVARWK